MAKREYVKAVKAEVEAKPEPKRNQAADKRLKAITSRHKHLPTELIDRMKKCDSSGQVKRLLKAYLQSSVQVV